MVRVLLEHGAEVDARDADGQTPLHYAALCEQLPVAEALLAAGADVRLKTNDGSTARDLGPDSWTCWPS